MKALQVSDGVARLVETSVPEASGEALVRVVSSGICNTDLEIVRGYGGFNGIIGHEFVGVVERCDANTSIEGKRVVGEINAGCGRCDLCNAGDSRHCRDRTVLGIYRRDGAHAEFLSLPSSNLIEVPNEVSDDEAVFAEPLAAALGIRERVSINARDRVAVIGDGKLGLLCAMTSRLLSEQVVLIGKHAAKIDIAEKFDIDGLLLENADRLSNDFDIVIEASGSASGFETALKLVRPRGTIVLKSTFHGQAPWEASRVVVDEISIVGSRCGRMAPAVELLASKSLNVNDLISDHFKLADGVEALGRAAEQGVLKVLLSP